MNQLRASAPAQERGSSPAAVVDVSSELGLRQALARCAVGERVVAIVEGEAVEPYLRLLDAGAHAVLPQGSGEQEVEAAVRSALAGCVTVPRRVLSAVQGTAGASAAPAGGRDPRGALGTEQRAILQLLAAGASNLEIGRRLHLTERTVQRRLATLLTQLGVGSRTEAAALAGRWGMWQPGSRVSPPAAH